MILKILSYPRSILLTALYPAFLLFCSVTCIVQNLIFNRRDFDDAVVGFWGKGSCKMFGVKVEVIGAENIPKSGGVFLFNHTSFFDIFAMAGYLQSVRFGAKIELFKIPFFGWAMRRVGILPIARRNREEVFRIYQEAKPRLLAGEKIALAPEGTRQISDEKLGPFKAGPFVFAITAQVPVIPIVIKNASQILPKHAWFPNLGVWERAIQVHVLPAIETVTLSLEERPILQGKVLESMQPYFTTFQDNLSMS